MFISTLKNQKPIARHGLRPIRGTTFGLIYIIWPVGPHNLNPIFFKTKEEDLLSNQHKNADRNNTILYNKK
jgi:hypothetical protein